jgi:hypothetical protein
MNVPKHLCTDGTTVLKRLLLCMSSPSGRQHFVLDCLLVIPDSAAGHMRCAVIQEDFSFGQVINPIGV